MPRPGTIARVHSPSRLRAGGFDDAPFQRRPGGRVFVVGAVCSGTRFEGMVLGRVRQDGWNATDELLRMLAGSKFLPQLHWILLDGIAFGGLNVVDLRRLAAEAGVPAIAVMRRKPDLDALGRVVAKLPRPAARRRAISRAGPIHSLGGFVFQVQGAEPERAAEALAHFTDTGNVPEPLRLAHLVGAAIVTGQSGRRA